MKRILRILLLSLSLLLSLITASAQQSGSIVVGGDFEKFYPVSFKDSGFDVNIATELELGRSAVHYDSDWRGSLMAKFRFHTTRWGNGSRFMDSNLFQINNGLSTTLFVAGWWDATGNNANYDMLIWLRGGGTTYYYKANVIVSPTVYDGIQNQLPFAEQGGPNHTYKTTVDSYVNSGGLSYRGTAYFNGLERNYFAGNVGIGTENPLEKLAVNGNIRAKEIKVENSNWPDYVFTDDYQFPSLKETESYIKSHKHLPGIPSKDEVANTGINLGDLNARLLQKIEELTLHMIALEKKNEQQQKEIDVLKSKK